MAKVLFTRVAQVLKPSETYSGLTENVQGDVPDYGSQSNMTAGHREQDTYTLQQALDNMGFGKFHIKLSMLTGLAWAADSMEMMILSILSPALHCAWMLSSWKQALITTTVFCGQFLSSGFWGWMCDKHGRRVTLIMSTVLAFFYGVLSAFSPTFGWMLFLRGLVGIGVGGCPQSITLYSEFLPVTARAKGIIFVEMFWTVGSCFEVLLALIVMPTLGWRYLLIFSTIPLLIFAIFCVFLPESPRYDLIRGRNDLAEETLRKISRNNKQELPSGKLASVVDIEDVNQGCLSDLLTKDMRMTTVILCFLWFASGFCYYGVILLTTSLFEYGTSCYDTAGSANEPACSIACRNLDTSDYMNILWTTVAEFPGLLLTVVVIDIIGRKKTTSGLFMIYSLFILLINICTTRLVLTILLVIARATVAGAFQVCVIYTPEIFPTKVRATAVGVCNTMARLGAIISPYFAQVLVHQSTHTAVTIYGFTSICAAVLALLLPYETKGKQMADINVRETSESNRRQ